MKTDAVIFEVNMTIASEDITKKTVSTIITTIINDGTTTYLEICIRQKKSFTFVLRRNVFLLNALIIELTDVLLTVNFIKCYQAAIIMNK